MKKCFYAFLILFLGIISPQQINAQDETVIYTADFTKGLNDWKAEGDYASQGMWDTSQGALNVYGYMATEPCTGYLVSPTITLLSDNNTASFDHQGFYFGDMSKEATLAVREIGGEWVSIEGIEYPGEMDFSLHNSGKLVIPEAFNGKDVQFAFVYKVLNTANIGNWFIFNFTVASTGSSAPDNREEAGISYPVTEFTYTISEGVVDFPVLSNPNNLVVTYSSDNESVATIDEDGMVSVSGDGVTVIRATSEPTEKYKKGEASYTLTVKDKSIVFSAKFDKDACGFVEERTNGDLEAWMHMGYEGCMLADGYEKVEKMTDFYLISPEFTFDEAGNTVSFDQMASYFTNVEEQAQLMVRVKGGEWTKIEGITYPTDEGVDWHNSGVMSVPSEFNGKTGQIAFKYSSDGIENSGVWYVKNLIIKRAANTKKDPQIKFEKDAVEYEMGGSEEFVAPAIVNPNNVSLKYSSDNAAVAAVDELTGIVTIIAEGKAVITAVSEETDEFMSGKASYTITVTVPSGIDGVTADDVRYGKVYDFQGRRINKLGKGIYIVNGKKVVIK